MPQPQALIRAPFPARCLLIAMPKKALNPGTGLRSQGEREALIGLPSAVM